MGTTRLQVYNGALSICKERPLNALTDANKSRRDLDQVWNDSGVRYCLEQGQWQFAIRTMRFDADADVDTEFGYTYAFEKPTDWVLTSAVCSDERFKVPIHNYADATDYWRADVTPIFVQYVSDDDAFGGDLARWPQTFSEFVQAYFASKICLGMTGSRDLFMAIMGPKGDGEGGIYGQRKLIAKNRAFMSQPQRQPAQGSWSRARSGRQGRGPMGDGGTGGALTG